MLVKGTHPCRRRDSNRRPSKTRPH